MRLESQAFCGKRQVPVKRTGWVGPKIGGAAWERGDKPIRDADQSGGLVPVCFIGGSLDREKNNTIGHQAAFLFYSIYLLFQ